MAPKKTKKQRQRAPTPRRPAGAPPTRPANTTAQAPISTSVTEGATVDYEGEPAPAPAQPAPVPTARRRVERVEAAAATRAPVRGRAQTRSRYAGTSAALVAPLETDDPAIPFDRVPYVPADLKRVAIIASVMIAFIIVVGLIASNLIT